MKTKTYTFIALLVFSFSNIMAGEFSKVKSSPVPEMSPVSEMYRLAPVVPTEATFDEEIMGYRSVSLIPFTPEFADFSDILPEPAPVPSVNIMPEVPVEATFEDEASASEDSIEFLTSIMPSVPQEATFEDLR